MSHLTVFFAGVTFIQHIPRVFQVVQRVLGGLIPFSKRFSLSASLRPSPDFYGPFWIIVTLVFSIAFSGSIYEYITSENASALSTFNFGRGESTH